MRVYYSFIPMSDKMQIYKKECKMRNDIILFVACGLVHFHLKHNGRRYFCDILFKSPGFLLKNQLTVLQRFPYLAGIVSKSTVVESDSVPSP